MAMFTGFKPQGMQKIANRLGYSGDMVNFDSYLQQNPEKQRQMIVYEDAARKMAEGGVVRKFQQGGFNISNLITNPFQVGTQAVVYGPDGQQYGNSMIAERAGVTDVSYTQPDRRPFNVPVGGDVAFGGAPVGRGEPILRGDPRFDAMPRVERMPQINNYTQGYTPGYQNPFAGMAGPEADKFRKMAEDRRKQIGQAPTLEDVEKRYDMSTLDAQGFAVKLDSDGNPTRNREKVSFYKDKAQKQYDEQLAKHKEYQRIFGQNYTVGQAQDYDREQRIIKRNQDLKQLNPKFDLNYYNSPEYKQFQSDPRNNIGTMDMRYSPYFGQQGSGSIGSAEDKAYINYLRRTGQDNLIREGVIPQDKRGDFGNLAGLISDTLPSDFIPAQDPRDNVAISAPSRPEDARGGDIVERLAPVNNQAQQAYVPTTGTGEGQIPVFGTETNPQNITDATALRAQTGALPVGAVTQPELTPFEQSQLIDTSTGMGQANVVSATGQAGLAQAGQTSAIPTAQMTPVVAQEAVQNALATNQAAQTDVSDKAQILAAQATASSVANLNAAQGNAILMASPSQRAIREGELVDSVTNAETAKTFTEQVQAATATASDQATVAGQLATLTTNFDATNPPAWASGAIRGVQSVMQQRGLGASSIAGQALVQAAMESALPIAQADANTVRTFELQNLSNRQQRAMLAAQQRASFIGQEFDQQFQARVQNAAKISDVANRNFTADQQIQLENSRIANTLNLQNLTNRQALVLAEASALTGLDTSNLTNRQQAAVENAKSFLQVDMANLSNEQQSGMFNMQQLTQSILTDQAALNASQQFNATSQNQVDQFFANLRSQVEQFNATQSNAQDQFNAGELNTLARFNAEVMNARDQFNAQNQIAIAQNNAVWRRELATADTAAINRANELNAKAVLDISNEAYDDLWAFYADTMEWAWKSAENEQDRINALGVANISKEAQAYTAEQTKKAAGSSAIGSMLGTLGAAIIRGPFG